MIRRKRFVTIIIAICANVIVLAQTHQMEVGAYLGASWWKANGGLVNLPGVASGIEIDYALRGALSNHTELGIKTGVSFGFASAAHRLSDYEEQYTNQDYYLELVDYTISAKTYRQQQRQWQAMVPLFVSLKTHGLVINIGAKTMFVAVQTRQLDVTDAHILAYYPDFDVPVYDYLATGRLPGFKDHQTGKSTMPQWSVLLAGEVGYEWKLTNKSRFGVAAYVDYSIWNRYKNNPPARRLIDVAPILNTEYPVPDITINYLTNTYTDKLSFFSVGIHAYYAIFTVQKKYRSYQCRCLKQ